MNNEALTSKAGHERVLYREPQPEDTGDYPLRAAALVGLAGMAALALLLGITTWSHWPFILSIALTLCAAMAVQGRTSLGAICVGAVAGTLWVIISAWWNGVPTFVECFVPLASLIVLLVVIQQAAELRLGFLAASGFGTTLSRSEGNRQPPPDATAVKARAFIEAFGRWHGDWVDETDPWRSFDRFLREQLLEQIGAKQVRCFHVSAGGREFFSLSEGGNVFAPQASASRRWGPGGHYEPETGGTVAAEQHHDRPGESVVGAAGIEEHVALTGQPYLRGSGEPGPFLEALAARSRGRVTWCFPVRRGDQTIGLVRVGSLPRTVRRDPALLELISDLLSICWCRVYDVHELAVARRIDAASGVLGRGDFLSIGGYALAESTGTDEPVVLMVLALEGMRSLDDSARWPSRDRFVQRVGHILARRLRADDVVGRFSDDRFVALLRRVDHALGRMITDNLRRAVLEAVRNFEGPRSTHEDSLVGRLPLTESGSSYDASSAPPRYATGQTAPPLNVRCALVSRQWTCTESQSRPDVLTEAQSFLHEAIADAFACLHAARLRGEDVGTDV